MVVEDNIVIMISDGVVAILNESALIDIRRSRA